MRIGDDKTLRAHISVKHQNISDADIQAKIAFIHEPKFVKDEVIEIGDGAEQTVTLKKSCLQNFKIYFETGKGEKQGFEFSTTGKASRSKLTASQEFSMNKSLED